MGDRGAGTGRPLAGHKYRKKVLCKLCMFYKPYRQWCSMLAGSVTC